MTFVKISLMVMTILAIFAISVAATIVYGGTAIVLFFIDVIMQVHSLIW